MRHEIVGDFVVRVIEQVYSKRISGISVFNVRPTDNIHRTAAGRNCSGKVNNTTLERRCTSAKRRGRRSQVADAVDENGLRAKSVENVRHVSENLGSKVPTQCRLPVLSAEQRMNGQIGVS